MISEKYHKRKTLHDPTCVKYLTEFTEIQVIFWGRSENEELLLKRHKRVFTWEDEVLEISGSDGCTKE